VKKTHNNDIQQTHHVGVLLQKFIAIENPIEKNSIGQQHEEMGNIVRNWKTLQKRRDKACERGLTELSFVSEGAKNEIYCHNKRQK